MDCDRFDQHVIDALYDELDELTYAALKRHVEGCARCASVWAGLRATREVGILPIEEPPDDLEARILDAVQHAQRRPPWHKTVLRGLAWAGSHAMRPQLAMAALFFLVIGSSLLLLRPQGAADRSRPVAVTERGAPAQESEGAPAAAAATAAPVAVAAASAPAPAAPAIGAADRVADRGAIGNDTPADERAKGSADEARAALADARAVRDASGCAAAVAKLDAVAVAFAGSQAAADAMWDEARCYKQMGEGPKAQQLFLALRSTGYRERAEQQLDGDATNTQQQNAVAGRMARPASPPPAAAPAKPAGTAEVAGNPGPARAAARPAPAGGLNPRAPAAPKKAVNTDMGF